MADDKCRTHADEHLLAVETAVDQFLGLLRDGHQAFDKEFGDTGDELHHGTHGHAKGEYILHVEPGHGTDEHAHDDAQHQRFTHHAKLLFQTFSVDVESVETGNFLKQPVDANGKGNETLTERLRHRDAIHALIITLKFEGTTVSNNQRDDIADNGCHIAPHKLLVEDEIGHGSDEGKVPIVPKVDVHRACGLGDQHQQVDAQTDGDNQSSNGCIIGHRRGGRPSHVEHLQLEVIEA